MSRIIFIQSFQTIELESFSAVFVTLSYFGAEEVMPGYNLMGVVKFTLESAVCYLAHDLGEQAIRVNAINA